MVTFTMCPGGTFRIPVYSVHGADTERLPKWSAPEVPR